jgi:hypothetical protein
MIFGGWRGILSAEEKCNEEGLEGLRVAAILSLGLQEKVDRSVGRANFGDGNSIFVWG